MDHSEACKNNSRRRRDDAKRRRVEAAVGGLVGRYGLPPDAAQTLSEGYTGSIGTSSHKNPLTIKIGIIASGSITRVTLRNGLQMRPIPRFQCMSPIRESSRPT
jgi:hypothetical protein